MDALTSRSGVHQPLPGVVYPPSAVLQEYLQAGVLTQETLVQGLRAAFSQYAQRPALCLPGQVITYQQLDESTDRLAAALLQLGVQPAQRVLFHLGNSLELVLGWIACLKAGIIPVCTLAGHRELELGYLGQHSAAALHFIGGDDAKFDELGFARKLREMVPTLRWTLQARGEQGEGHTLSNTVLLHELIAAMPLQQARERLATLELDPFQVAIFQLSGGTSGVPKIIPRFHNEYLYNMREVARVNGYRSDDVLFMPLPLMHNLSMGCCVGPVLLTGGAYAIAPDLKPESLEQLFTEYQPSWAVMGGPILERLRPAIEAGRLPLQRLRGALSPNNSSKIAQILGCEVLHIFGMTEGVIMLTRVGDPAEVRETMIGRPVSPWDRVKLLEIDSEREITTENTVGECVFQGPYTIHGYYDAPEKNREAFTSDGYYRSGDLMSFHIIDGVKHFRFCGRSKDVVDRAGEKISSEEVERVVARHPAVAMASVVGMPDPVYRERVCAFVKLREEYSGLSVKELGSFLEQQGLAKFKWPERVETVQEFPLTGSGKLSKPLLRQAIGAMLQAEQQALASSASLPCAHTHANTAADVAAVSAPQHHKDI